MNRLVHEIALMGPTAVGKTEIAVVLAEELDGEIISVDSMQVYRGLNIGTAKPSMADRRGVTHHLLDVVDLHESFSAGEFVRLTSRTVEEIRDRRHLPILCGGTGLYFRAWQEGLSGETRPAEEERRQLESRPTPALLAELRELDPEAMECVDTQNHRRVVRALEIVKGTGRRLRESRAGWSARPAPRPGWFVLDRHSEDLRERVDKRVDAMFERGIVEETRELLNQGLGENRTAMQAIGYRQVVEYLDGLRSLEETRDLIRRKTWQLVRRQRTWFRHQVEARWIRLEPEELPMNSVNRILSQLNA